MSDERPPGPLRVIWYGREKPTEFVEGLDEMRWTEPCVSDPCTEHDRCHCMCPCGTDQDDDCPDCTDSTDKETPS